MILASLLTSAFAAQTAAQTAGPANSLMNFVPLIVIMGVFYFLIIRPQQKKQKQFQEKINSLKVGDKVAACGGIIGTVKEMDSQKDTIVLQVSENTNLTIYKRAISDIITDQNEQAVIKK